MIWPEKIMLKYEKECLNNFLILILTGVSKPNGNNMLGYFIFTYICTELVDCLYCECHKCVKA